MKRNKIILLLLAFVVAVTFVLASCGDKNPPDTGTGTDTSTGTETDTGDIKPEVKEGTIIFKNADGTVINSVTDKIGTKISYVPEKEGYKACEYYSDAELTKKIAAVDKIAEGETVVFVKFVSPIRYTVSFDAGRGYGEMSDITLEYGKRASLPGNTFALKGETFAEWRLYSDDGSYVSYVDGARIRNLTATDGKVLKLVAVFENEDTANFVIENGVVISYNGSEKTVVFPEYAASISKDVFKNNKNASKITKIVVPACYKTIEQGAFTPCTSIAELTVPFIGGSENDNNFIAYLFGADTYLDNDYSFEAKLTYSSLIPDPDHSDFSKLLVPQTLKKVTITGEIRSIAEGAFYKIYSLECVSIPNYDKLVTVGAKAFDGCWQLGIDNTYGVQNPLYWLENVKAIGDRAFAAYISKENQDGGSYIFTRLFEISKLSKIETIGKEAFYGCVYLKKADFGPSLKTVGDYAFTNCASLTELNFPDATTSIGEYAFTSCAAVTKITFGTGIANISAFAFADCNALASVTFASSSPARISPMVPFSNGIESKYNASNWLEGYKPVFTYLKIYVTDGALQSYKDSWTVFTNYLFSKDNVSTKLYYYNKMSDGSYSALLRVEGNMIYVTDPNGELLSILDPISSSGFGTEYVLYFKDAKAVTDGTIVAVGSEIFITLSSPKIVDYFGYEFETTVRVRPEIYEKDGKSYTVDTLELLSAYGSKGVLGTNDKSLYKIVDDGYGHAKLYARNSVDEEFAEVAAPEGTVYTEIFLYVSLVYDEQYLAVVYENENAEPIEHKYFFMCDDALVPADYQKNGTAMVFLSYGDFQIVIDGSGNVKFNLYNSSYEVEEFVGKYTESGKYGDAVYTLTFNGLASGTRTLSGTAVFDGWFDNGYHRCKVVLSSEDSTIYRGYGYRSSDMKDDGITCINAVDKSKYYLFDYVNSNGETALRYVIYTDSNGIEYHGEYTKDGDTLNIRVDDFGEKTARIVDKRNSIAFDGVFGDVVYQRYDGETYTYYMYENFYGTIIDYYVLKMDGYGNALLHDIHDDDIDVWYTGTYYNTGRYLGEDDYGKRWIYCMEGVECDSKGIVKENGAKATFYYIVSNELNDDDTCDILSITQAAGDTVSTVYSSEGFKLASLKIDPFGVTEITVYDHHFENGEIVYTENTELTSKLQCVAYLNSSTGMVEYVVVYDGAGNFMFLIYKDSDGEFTYSTDRKINPEEKETIVIVPDFSSSEE